MKYLALAAVLLVGSVESFQSRWRGAEKARRASEELRQKTEQIEKLKRSRTYPYFQLDVF